MIPSKQEEEMINQSDGRKLVFLDASTIQSLLSYPSLIQHLQNSLLSTSSSIQSPIRQKFSLNPTSSLLLMPSWSSSISVPYIGVKIVTTFSQNSARNLPGVNASYLLFDSFSGINLAVIDGSEMTHWRTSSLSALAAKFLAREDSEILVMIGAGSLASYLIKAHLSVRSNLKKVIIWNRTVQKAIELSKKLQEEKGTSHLSFEYEECVDDIVKKGDIICCATSSKNPIINGSLLKAGTHLDLVGSFSPSMKECDDEAIKRGKVFVDCEAALTEAGELVGAFDRGIISREDIGGRLIDLISGKKIGRRSSKDITVFKSVGSATIDLLTAQMLFETHCLQLSNESKLSGP